MIILIWAQTKKNVIGSKNSMPWHIKEEMNHFKNTTLNHDILMGSNTFKSLNYKPLIKRNNFVLTRDISQFENINNYSNLFFIDDMNKIINKYKNSNSNDIYIIGGSQIYNLFMPYADKIIKSIIKKEYPGDILIEEIDYKKFKIVKNIEHEEFYIEYLERKI